MDLQELDINDELLEEYKQELEQKKKTPLKGFYKTDIGTLKRIIKSKEIHSLNCKLRVIYLRFNCF